ncbi:MAG: tetratricopeptide repeat protein [Opitutales bacterium]
MIVQVSGVRPGTQAVGLIFMSLTLALHGIWLALGRDSVLRLHRPLLWLLPFLALLLAHVLYLSPTPWLARWDLLLGFQAFFVAWVCANGLRGREKVWLFFILLCVILGLSGFLGLRQFSERPDWLGIGPTLPEEFGLFVGSQGYATGTTPHPQIFSGLLLLLIPMLLAAGLMRKLLAALRLLCLLSGLLFFGVLVLTRDTFALTLASVAIVLLMLICLRTWKKRILGVAIAGLFVGAAWGGFYWLESSRPIEQEPPGLSLEEVRALGVEPGLWGVGAGNFNAIMSTDAAQTYLGHHTGAASSLVSLWVEFGWAGLALLGLPLVWICGVGLRGWVRLPLKETEFADVPIRRGKRLSRPALTERVFQTAAIFGVVLFGIHLLIAFHLEVPGALLVAAALTGIALKPLPQRTLPLPAKLPRWLITLLPTFFMSVVLGVVVVPLLRYSELSLRTAEGIQRLQERDPELDPFLLKSAANMLREVIAKDPAHLDARAWLAYVVILESRDAREDAAAIRAEVNELARTLVEAYPNNPYYRSIEGLGHWLNNDLDAAEASFRAGIEARPGHPLPRYYLGELLKLRPNRIEEAGEMLASVEALQPTFPRIAERRSLLSLSRGVELEKIDETLRAMTEHQLPPLVFVEPPARGILGFNRRFIPPPEYRPDFVADE